jgi:hypothetical protein
MTRWTFVAVVLALGCGKSEDPGPSCEQVTDHVFEITSKAFPGHGDMGNRKAYIESCKSRNLSASEKRCMLAAQDTLSLAKCRKVPEGARPPTGKPPVPEPVKGPDVKPAAP